jgi:hypothetical protein
MWLVSDLTPADIDDPQPGTVIAGRIEVDDLAEPFKFGALLVMQVLEPDAQVSRGGLYILDDGSDVAIVRMQGESPDLWMVDRFSGDGGFHRCALPGADGDRERQSRFNRAPTAQLAPVSVSGFFFACSPAYYGAMTDFPFPPMVLSLAALVGLFFVIASRGVLNERFGLDSFSRIRVTLGMQVVVSVVILGASLFVILSQRYTTADAHWAYGMVGTVIGFWLKR